MSLVSKVRTRTGALLVGGAVVLSGGGVAAAVTAGTSEPTEVSVSTPDTATVAPETAVEPAPAATLDAVTTSEAATTAAPPPEQQVAQEPENDGIGTTGADGQYTPAPPRQEPGAPPVGNPPQLPPAPPLPGEPNYTG